GLTSIRTKAPADKWRFGLNELNPSIRGKNGHIIGFDKAVPRIHLTGPIWRNKLGFSESFVYQLRKDPVRGLAWPRNETKKQGFNSLTNFQLIFSPQHLMTAQVHLFPLRRQFANLNALVPQSASSDVGQRGFSVGGTDAYRLGGGSVVTSIFKVTHVPSYAHGQGSRDMLVTPNGLDGHYFNTWTRTSNQQEASVTLDLPSKGWFGRHEIKTGVDFIHRSFDGSSRSRPVLLLGPDGSTAGRIDFSGSGVLAVDDTQVAGFANDHWTLNDQLALDLGLRYSGQSIGGRADFAPRLGLVYSPGKDSKTVFRGGIGIFHDRVPLLAGDFTDNLARTLSIFDGSGVLSGAPITFHNVCAQPEKNRLRILTSCRDFDRTPYNLTWKLSAERELHGHLLVRLGYLSSRSYRVFVIDPVQPAASDPMLMLSNKGSARYHEFEATARFRPNDRSELTVSYLHSRSRGDLNTVSEVFVPFEQPVIRPNLYANLGSDLPNRLTAFGFIKFPWGVTFSPAIDLHTGFPYSNVDVLQNYVGTPNSQRLPTYFTLGMKGYKEFRVHILPKAPKIRLGFYSVNATNRRNAHTVFNNIASPFFGQPAGLAKRVNGIVLDFIH
ncbi:MAG: TonB-dependent receptor, partial [Acidobacteria bacterium]|nr:TonB-dependent receptor [Acidobacteriota bacterium]